MPRTTKPAKHKPSGTIQGVDLFTTQAAATMLRPPVSDRRIRALAASLGVGTRVGRALMLTRADIDRLQNERRPAAGRPPAGRIDR